MALVPIVQPHTEHKALPEHSDQLSALFVREMSHQLTEGLEKIHHCLKQLNDEQVWCVRLRPKTQLLSDGYLVQQIVAVKANPLFMHMNCRRRLTHCH
jgi:hypothetical protein